MQLLRSHFSSINWKLSNKLDDKLTGLNKSKNMKIKFAAVIVLLASVGSFFEDCILHAANGGRILSAESIEIKRKSENSLKAKESALSAALQKAFFRILVNRFGISDAKDNAQINSISQKEMSNCVYDYSIENEKRSESIYICEIIYRFDEDKVINLLQKHGVISILDRKNKSEFGDINVAFYTDDFIRSNDRFAEMQYVIKRFSSEYVVVTIKNCTIEDVRRFGLPYAQL